MNAMSLPTLRRHGWRLLQIPIAFDGNGCFGLHWGAGGWVVLPPDDVAEVASKFPTRREAVRWGAACIAAEAEVQP